MKHNKFKMIPPSVTPKKKKEWTKAHTVIFIMIIIWSLGSILGSIAFFRTNKDNFLNSNITAYADTVVGDSNYTFYGSNIMVPMNYFNRDFSQHISGYNSTMMNWQCELSRNSDGTFYIRSTMRTFGKNDIVSDSLLEYIPSNNVSHTEGTTFESFNPSTNNDLKYYLAYNWSQFQDIPKIRDYYFGIVTFNIDSNFNCNVKSIEFSSWSIITTSDVSTNTDSYQVNNLLTYVDSNGARFTVRFIVYTNPYNGWRDIFSYDTRTYLLTEDLSDNEYWNSGYWSGYFDALDEGHDATWQDGYNRGFSEGENKGYNDGLLAGDNISFLGLFTALLDAPLQAITGLFNFDLLGFNMLGFVSAIFTAMVILIIIKMIFGGGGGKGG